MASHYIKVYRLHVPSPFVPLLVYQNLIYVKTECSYFMRFTVISDFAQNLHFVNSELTFTRKPHFMTVFDGFCCIKKGWSPILSDLQLLSAKYLSCNKDSCPGILAVVVGAYRFGVAFSEYRTTYEYLDAWCFLPQCKYRLLH